MVQTYSDKQLKEMLNYAHFGLEDIANIKTKNVIGQLIESDPFFEEHPELAVLKIMKNPDYLYFTTKHLLNIELLPSQCVILKELWTRTFPMLIASRGLGKSFLLSVYALLRCLLEPGCKFVLVGAAFRQSKILFDYIETIYTASPVMRSMISEGRKMGPKRDVDQNVFYFPNNSRITAIPMGTGEKIRGLRANYLLVDEFSSIPLEIYEVVVGGFASVLANPVESHKAHAKKELLKNIGLDKTSERSIPLIHGGISSNQSVISGTAGWDWDHFADYWKQYKTIIESKGDPDKLSEIGVEVGSNFDWRDYSIMRIPYELAPKNFMDEKQIMRAKTTVHSGTFGREYGAVFAKDSTGFFRASLIQSCVADEKNEKNLGCVFHPRLKGDPNAKYVYGIDPAAAVDNFAIIILEIHPDHRRVVHCWTTNMKSHRELKKKGLTNRENYYAFCARKLRDLMRLFPCAGICLDRQGGGISLEQALQEKELCEEGEVPIWEFIDYDKPKETDDFRGEHLIHIFSNTKAEVASEANHGLKRDMENKQLLFPFFDTIAIELSIHDDKVNNRLYDTLEDCILEIEELKNELSIIVLTETAKTGREHWDTPEIKLPGNKKGHLRKDRYTALLQANYLANQIFRNVGDRYHPSDAMFEGSPGDESMYYAPEWFQDPSSWHVGNTMARGQHNESTGGGRRICY